MNRKERRAATAHGNIAAKTIADIPVGHVTSAAPADIARLMAEATAAYHQGRPADVEVICKQIQARVAHAPSLNLLGMIYQASGRHRLAVKTLARAIALDDLDAASHYNIGLSHHALDERAAAAVHFRKAIALGLSGRDVEQFLMRDPLVIACASRMMDRFGFPAGSADIFTASDIAEIADNVFLQCALETAVVRGATLEFFLTALRRALLHRAAHELEHSARVSEPALGLLCAVAQQCFLNEYVFSQDDDEAALAVRLRDELAQKLAAAGEFSAPLLAAVAAYFPLHALAEAKSLLDRKWPRYVEDLLRQQVREPLEEAEDRSAIAALTPIKDVTSIEVMRQYEENPYPRWTVNPLPAFARDGSGVAGDAAQAPQILIAGCGTGEHPFDIAQKSPHARILAVDLSLASLAYARRKTREEGLPNIDYAQADILELGTLERTFDRIEAVGALHHLADPSAGWRVLLKLLRPHGIMRVGLYSEAARRAVVEARALVAARGYHARAQDIRALRQTILREKDDPRWDTLIRTIDFYSMSGCRDMLFNVMEHRFSIPQIAAFLREEGLSFLGFELDAKVIERFCAENPAAEALTDLDRWSAFEAANPHTFRNMYVFSVRKDGLAGG